MGLLGVRGDRSAKQAPRTAILGLGTVLGAACTSDLGWGQSWRFWWPRENVNGNKMLREFFAELGTVGWTEF